MKARVDASGRRFGLDLERFAARGGAEDAEKAEIPHLRVLCGSA
jgi:hypothetical protein